MTKFEEMRLRVFKFCEITGIHIEINPFKEFITINGKIRWSSRGCLADTHDKIWVDISEDEFLLRANNMREGVPFPSLLEAQGWVDVKIRLPHEGQKTQVIVDCFGEVTSGVSNGFNVEHGIFKDVSHGTGWCAGIQAKGEYSVIRWQPLAGLIV